MRITQKKIKELLLGDLGFDDCFQIIGDEHIYRRCALSLGTLMHPPDKNHTPVYNFNTNRVELRDRNLKVEVIDTELIWEKL